MAVHTKLKEGIAVLKVRGDLMGGPETMEVRKRVKALLSDGTKNLVLDLGGVAWMNSNGMGMLMACYSSAQQAEGRLVLSRVSPKVNQLMGITKIDRLFDHFETVGKAKKSFD